MKTYAKVLAIFSMMTFVFAGTSFAQFDSATAVTLPESGTASGTMTTDNADYWWKITLSNYGKLLVETTSEADLDIDLFMLDADLNQIASYDISSGTQEATHRDDLAPGTYYIKANRYRNEGSYTITSTVTLTTREDDTQTNETVDEATAFSLNASDTGHLGYYSLGNTDTIDWWKVETTADGKLTVTTLSEESLNIDLFLFDQDKTTQIASYDISSGVDEATHYNNLTPGTYYVKALRYSGYGSYTITSAFEAVPLNVDLEPNDTPDTALILGPDMSDTGHLGYFKQGETDTVDWWKISTAHDGALKIATLSNETLDIDLFIFGEDKETQIAGYDINSGVNEETHHNFLAPGTYYIKILRYSGYGSYTVTSEFTRTLYANDTEPNDTVETAQQVNILETYTGHQGFYNSGIILNQNDFFTFTLTETIENLYIRSETDASLEVDLYLHDAGGSQIGYAGASGVSETLNKTEVVAGTYYVHVLKYSGYGSYSFIVSGSPDTVPDPVDITLDGSIAGTVTDATTEEGVAGATVSTGSVTATTDENGAYSLSPVPAGTVNVTVAKDGFTASTSPVVVTAGETAIADFALTQSLVVELFSDDFNDNAIASGWSFLRGDWSESDSVMKQADNYWDNDYRFAGGVFAIAGSADWSDYTVSSRIRSDDNDRMGLVFRYQDADNFYVFSWDRELTDRAILRVLNGVEEKIASDTVPYEIATWYNVKIVAVGSSFQLFVDDVLVLEATDSGIAAGKAGLYNNGNDNGFFDDFIVNDSTVLTGVGTISGTVTDFSTGNSISGATVTVMPGDYSATTAADGSYSILSVQPGADYSVMVGADGFEASEGAVAVIAEEATTHDVTLFAVPPVVIGGPVATSVAASPNPTKSADVLTVTATISSESAAKIAPFTRNEITTLYMNGSKNGAAKPAQVSSVDVGNEFIKAYVDSNNGEIQILTADDKKLLYTGRFSGATRLNIDGATYPFGSASGTWSTPLAASSNEVRGVWTIEDISVTFTLSIIRSTTSGAFDTFKITYAIENTGETSREVGLYKMLDTDINGNDSAPVSAGGGFNRLEREFIGAVVPNFWNAYEVNPTQAADKLISQGTLFGGGAVRPDKFVIGQFGNLENVDWDYTPSGEYSDSAVGMWWNPVSLSAGAQRMVATLYGLGAVETVAGDINMTLSAESILSVVDNALLPNPFQATALVTNSSGVAMSDVEVTISLPEGLSLSGDDSNTKIIGTLEDGVSGQVRWRVEAAEKAAEEIYTYNVTVTSSTEGISDAEIIKTVTVPAIETGAVENIVTAAELYIDTDPGAGNGQAMSVVFGSFDSTRENVTADVDISALSIGQHRVYVRGKDLEGTWGTATSFLFNNTEKQPEGVVIDVNIGTTGPQGNANVSGIGDGERVGFAVYIDNNEDLRAFEIDLQWDGAKATIKSGDSGPHIPDDELNINGITDLIIPEEDNILGGSVSPIVDVNEIGHYRISIAKLGGDSVTEPAGLLFFAVLKTSFEFTPADTLEVAVNVKLVDDSGNEFLRDEKIFRVAKGEFYAPPTNVIVSDTPDDHGHSLELSWTLSPDDEAITQYNIYRSRYEELTDTVNIETFNTVEDLIEAEEVATILIGNVPRGESSYLDDAVPVSGGMYYYWIEAASGSGSSAKVAAGWPTAVTEMPRSFDVSAPYPNPFNPTVNIDFELPSDSRVTLHIYDVLGRKVATLVDSHLSAGMHNARWNGRNQNGELVGSGVYLYKLTAGALSSDGKMVYLR